MQSTFRCVDRYLKIRQLEKEELKPVDMLNMMMDRYIIPNEKEVNEFIKEAKDILPEYKDILLKYKKDYIRITKLKKIINDSTYSPVISFKPLIIDFDKYKNKKDISQNYFFERGKFKVKSCAGDVLVIARDEEKQENIRLNIKGEIDKYVKKGDMVELLITRKLFMVYWDVVKVYKCIPSSMV